MTPADFSSISIIIPVLNEEACLPLVLKEIGNSSLGNFVKEILVVDGGSTDASASCAHALGASVLSAPRGRAVQMNYGARHAQGDILYFLHADTLPPPGFDLAIVQAVRNGRQAGSFRLRFDHPGFFLRSFSWCTRINHRLCRGGDQSLFVTKGVFELLKGFNEQYRIYEDVEFAGRLYRQAGFTVLPEKVLTSARKYKEVGMLRLQFHFGIIHLLALVGAGPKSLNAYYQSRISGRMKGLQG